MESSDFIWSLSSLWAYVQSYDFIALLLKLIFILIIGPGLVPIMVWLERRGSAMIQGRMGPNRVGPLGLLQALADVLKFFAKEPFVPGTANKFYYNLAPMIAAVAPLAAFAAIPFGGTVLFGEYETNLQLSHLNIGILAALAFAGLEVYPIMLAGWASNNKYAVLGALRGASQMISYEIAMGLALIAMFLIYGTVDMNQMVAWQGESLFGILPRWGLFVNPLAAMIFLIGIFAETNRMPFDLPEGDAELVAGYHVEYGSTKFAMFFFAEYVAMSMAAALFVTLFLGGYGLLPGMETVAVYLSQVFHLEALGLHNLKTFMGVGSFLMKLGFMLFFYIWVRWTVPRFRFDQLMNLGWRILLPIGLVNLVFTAIAIYLIGG
ncbi:MAG: NADH-quinone oxidoreductase subunit NuoH [Pseudomonadota bacterium]